MPGNADQLTLFIVHWNHPARCTATVRALQEQERNLRVVIIDNNSLPQNRAALPVDSSIELLPLAENKGWGSALNIALRNWLDHSTGEFCLISAHDAVPGANCVAKLRSALTENPHLGIASPQYPDNSVPHLSALHGVVQKIVSPPGREQVQNVDLPHGTLMILRRQCLAEIGLFDERYFAYGDDHELGARACRHGWQVGLVWGATVANPETSTPREWRSYLFARNSLLLVHDYFGRTAAWLRFLVILGNTIRLTARKNGFAPSAHVVWRGCRDYFANRFGPPPSR